MSHGRVPHLSVTNRGLLSVFTGSGDRAASTVSVVPGVRAPLLAEHGAGLGVAPAPGQASWKVGRWPPQLQQAFRRLSVSRRLFCGHMGAEGPERRSPGLRRVPFTMGKLRPRAGLEVPRPRPAEPAVRAEPGPEAAPLGPLCPLQTRPAMGSAAPALLRAPVRGHPLETVSCCSSRLQAQFPAHCCKSRTKTQTLKSPPVTQCCLKTEWRWCVRAQRSPGPQRAQRGSMAPPTSATGKGGHTPDWSPRPDPSTPGPVARPEARWV